MSKLKENKKMNSLIFKTVSNEKNKIKKSNKGVSHN